MGIYDYRVKTIDGKETTLEPYRGKVLLIVNVASECGYTPQYEGLQALHRKYGEKGFAVLGFPCNQFGAQEPGTEPEIRSFCESRYQVTFPLFAKVDVNGPQAHALYQHLKKEEGGPDIKWNFTKFLVDREGKVRKRFAPQREPGSLEGEIDSLL